MIIGGTMISTLDDLTKQQVLFERGNDAARWVFCLLKENGARHNAKALFDSVFTDRAALYRVKTPVDPASTLSSIWAPIAPTFPGASALVELSTRESIVGRIPGVRRVGLQSSTAVATSGASVGFVQQTGPKPATTMAFTSATLPPAKVSGIVVLSDELARLGTPSALNTVRSDLTRAIASYLDDKFTDHANAGVANAAPASITNAAFSIGSSGTSAANVLTDFKLLVSTFIAENPGASGLVLITSPTIATAIAVATTTQTLGPNGGTIYGIPVVTGNAGARLILVDPSAVILGDEGEIDLDLSRQASVEMNTAPTSPQGASSVLVSLFQAGLVGLRATRLINWKLARPSACVYCNVAYV